MKTMKAPSEIPPTKKQLDFCYGILKRIKTCEADEHGQPLFELSMENADRFIKANRAPSKAAAMQYYQRASDNCSAGDWGGIPNH